jgi:hypothetical protein
MHDPAKTQRKIGNNVECGQDLANRQFGDRR